MREPVIISGAIVAASILERVKLETEALKSSGINPGLAVVIVGSDPASQVYVSSKGRKAEECGFLSRKYELPEITSEKELLGLVHTLNEDPKIHGLLLQLPLPKHLDAGKIIQAISPDKDVDGFHYVNVGMLGTGELEGALVPCTPAGAMLLIESVRGKDLSGLTAVVIGRSN
ncbi:tetrahydrofolate dehydrogenase/cyclohydrolase catalytic domain-containing protein, partial [Mesorhizobium sp. P5_C1]